MRLLIIDPPGHGVDIAFRAQKAGHEVKLAVRQDEKTKHIGRGLVEVIDDFRPWIRWPDLIINTDNTLYLHDLKRAREERPDVAIISACPDTAQWEINRQVGQKILEKCGIECLPSVTFHDYDKAISHVKKTMRRYVSKPTGDGTADKALSYCSSGPDDMVFMLERWKRAGKLKGGFMLQEFCKGTEMGVAGWFGPGGFNIGWEENFEFKKLHNGDLGVATGEQGTVLRYVKHSKLADMMLKPLVPELEKMGYCGDIDVNCIIDEKGKPWPLEFTTRLGWPAHNLQLALVKEDPVEWLLDLAKGKDARPFIMNQVCVGVVLSIPDYPYSHVTRKEVTGIPIYGCKGALWKHIHPCEMMLAECPWEVDGKILNAPMPATAGDYVLVMTALGETVQGARDLCYLRMQRLKVPNSPAYRTDIGNRLRRQLPEIQKHGFARRLHFSQPEL